MAGEENTPVSLLARNCLIIAEYQDVDLQTTLLHRQFIVNLKYQASSPCLCWIKRRGVREIDDKQVKACQDERLTDFKWIVKAQHAWRAVKILLVRIQTFRGKYFTLKATSS